MASLVSLGEQHDPEGSTDGLWWEVLGKACQDCSVVAVGGCYASPDGLVALVLVGGGLVHVDHSLSEVPLGSGAVIDTLKLQDGLVFVLLGLRPE